MAAVSCSCWGPQPRPVGLAFLAAAYLLGLLVWKGVLLLSDLTAYEALRNSKGWACMLAEDLR